MGELRQSVLEKGYVILERVYSERDCADMREIFRGVWEREGQPGAGEKFGFVMHPVLKYAPELASFYARKEVVEALREVLGGEARLAHSGALMSDGSRGFTDWHYHRSDIMDAAAWNPDRTDRPTGIERVLGNVYIDGSNDELGPLLLYPRKIDDVLAPPHNFSVGDWPGQTVVYCPPGSMVIFEQSVWHAARPARASRLRHLWGGHYQAWSNPTPHREDNHFEGAELLQYKTTYPLFRTLVERPACAVASI
jgi:hypothetical protein